jgi:two-component system, NarL family, response regulator LiaR
MRKNLFIYGLFLAILSTILKATEYWFWIKLNVFDVYALLIALIFLGAGLWLGMRFNQKNSAKKPENGHYSEELVPIFLQKSPKIVDEQFLENLGISKREYAVLALLEKGMSNQEIADILFISQNTVKTHTSRLFEKLAVKNRTQAILKSKELRLTST